MESNEYEIKQTHKKAPQTNKKHTPHTYKIKTTHTKKIYNFNP